MNQLFLTYYNGIKKENDLKKPEKEFLCDYVKKLNQMDKEAFYMLIYYYYEFEGKNEKDEIEVYPYESSKNNLRGIDFNLSKIPYKLRQMLYKFCKIIEQKEEDSMIEITLKKEK